MVDLSRIGELLAMFGPLARKADPWPVHWITDGDAGPDYCLPCCRNSVASFRWCSRYPEAVVDGGWDDSRSSDYPTFCEVCRRLLGYSLTKEGLCEELEYWCNADDKSELTPVHAYEIEAVLTAAREVDDADLVADAIKIGERMLPLLKTANAPS